jgi:glycerol-3-phosphate acyltransferase PlsY
MPSPSTDPQLSIWIPPSNIWWWGPAVAVAAVKPANMAAVAVAVAAFWLARWIWRQHLSARSLVRVALEVPSTPMEVAMVGPLAWVLFKPRLVVVGPAISVAARLLQAHRVEVVPSAQPQPT